MSLNEVLFGGSNYQFMGLILGSFLLRTLITHPVFHLLPPPRRLCFCLGLFVGLSVCEFVCEQDNSKTYGRILMKFSGYV